MGTTNSEVVELERILKMLKYAKEEIAQTQRTIKASYLQLGTYWNDKHYRELQVVISDCYKALNDIGTLMLQGEKYVTALVTQIKDYESVNLGSGNGRNAFVNSLRVDPDAVGANDTYQYCLGVLSKGSFSENYASILTERHANAESSVRRVFDHYANRMMIRDSAYPADCTAHYAPINQNGHERGVYYNASADENNPRGSGATFFHELAHMIDHTVTEYQGNLSNSDEFAWALIQDGQNLLVGFQSLPVERQQAFQNRINQDSYHSFSDLIDATTNGQLHGRYGHSREYWTYPGNLQAEAFAHFFEASMGDHDKMEMLANAFPSAFAIFSSMIDDIQPSVYERQRTR